MRRVVSVVCAALATVTLAGSPALAQVASSDVAVGLESTRVTLATLDPNANSMYKGDTGIGYVTVVIRSHNYGPENTTDTSVVKDITAPPGTVFRQLDEKYFAQWPGLCTVVVPHTRVRCKVNGSMWLDTYNGGSGGHTTEYYFVLKKKCVTPGRFRLDYAGDPKTSNNSVSIPLKVPGVTAADCKPKPKPSPTRAAASPKPAALASPSAALVSAAASPSATEPLAVSAEPSPQAVALASSNEESSGSGLLIGVAGALVGAALLAGWWRYARRKPTETV
ncbi:hypothetical protein ACFQZ4_50945 [Catellatospora coxensis]|uniref:LPXTG-motif cell wall-anchored protein n=1 Tax=Catellatospora coxensis TaxID=310354 RepID=A0A8J3KPW5_9ACTN|nr:hypothetical protein [Catellatospora coxensis]GIG05030.1 hypothetical protein Cco03nite_17300 [Catellatospora coxensis]